MNRKLASAALVPALLLVGCGSDAPLPTAVQSTTSAQVIQHVVVIFGENVSFDHYFGTLAGVRGYGDPTAMTLDSGKSVFHQPDPLQPYSQSTWLKSS